jgi:hypothetical protein
VGSRVNFSNILQAAFMTADPEKRNKYCQALSFLRFPDLRAIRTAHKMLIKFTPEDDHISFSLKTATYLFGLLKIEKGLKV